MKKLTEADYARIRAEAQAVRDRALGVAVVPPKKEKSCPPKSSPSRRGKSAPRPPVYDRAKIVQMYVSGMRVGEIASVLGAHRGTIHRALVAEKVELRPDHGGPVRVEVCSQGHSMEDALEFARGGRACRKCKQKRDRESAKRRYWAKKESA